MEAISLGFSLPLDFWGITKMQYARGPYRRNGMPRNGAGGTLVRYQRSMRAKRRVGAL